MTSLLGTSQREYKSATLQRYLSIHVYCAILTSSRINPKEYSSVLCTHNWMSLGSEDKIMPFAEKLMKLWLTKLVWLRKTNIVFLSHDYYGFYICIHRTMCQHVLQSLDSESPSLSGPDPKYPRMTEEPFAQTFGPLGFSCQGCDREPSQDMLVTNKWRCLLLTVLPCSLELWNETCFLLIQSRG